MKKTLIITLLIALVLGIFTACNGDVYSDLVGKRIITLVLSEEAKDDNITFKDGSDTLVLEIPSGCKTWKDLADSEFSIEVKEGDNEPFKVFVKDGKDIVGHSSFEEGYAHFAKYNTSKWYDVFGLSLAGTKGDPSPSFASDIEITEEIEIGGTYELTRSPWA